MCSPILQIAFSLSCWCLLHKVFNLGEVQRMFFVCVCGFALAALAIFKGCDL